MLKQIKQNPTIYIESQQKRFLDPTIINEILSLDEKITTEQFILEKSVRFNNIISTSYRKIKNGETVTIEPNNPDVAKFLGDISFTISNLDDLSNLSKKLKELIKEKELSIQTLHTTMTPLIDQVGNLVHYTVPVSQNENDAITVSQFGERKESPPEGSHIILTKRIGNIMTSTISEICGAGSYVLSGPILLLEMALTRYALDYIRQKNYTIMECPVFLKANQMKKVAQLKDFEDTLYKVGDDSYLIATSEQFMVASHADKHFTQNDLLEPIKLACYSECFRKETGRHMGENGIFRVHQFKKIEQFVICDPSTSWTHHDNLIKNTEEFYQSLELPYRVVCMNSGDLNLSTSKKYDLEGWFPASQTYKELVSCSNCTDYQSRQINCRFEKTYPHMLNSTLCALTRTICCLCENGFDGEKINLPPILRPYFGADFIALS